MKKKDCIFIHENGNVLFAIAIEGRKEVTEEFLCRKISNIYKDVYSDDYVIRVEPVKCSFMTELHLHTKEGLRILDWSFFRIY